MKAKSVVNGLAKTVLIAGGVGVVIVAPNALQAFEIFAGKDRSKHYGAYLKRSGYFDIESLDDTFVIRLSAKGQELAARTSLEEYRLPHPGQWDRSWHILMFDIPEAHKRYRDHIARSLKTLGLRTLQDSVYVYPFDLSGLAETIRSSYPKVASLVISARVTQIDGQSQLKQAFAKLISD